MIFILLPAYNEEESLHPVFSRIQTVLGDAGQSFKVIVGNDGSKDRTAEILEELKADFDLDVLTHKINRGLGETARDLFEYAVSIGAPDDVIIRMDCDNTHDPIYIPSMIAKLDEGHDVVIASRFQPGGGQKGVVGYRAFISYMANLFMKVFFPIKGVREYSCGYRAYRLSIVDRAIQRYGNNFIQLRGLGFTGTLEKLIKLKLVGARCSEVPFVLLYDQKLSASKMVSSITTFGYLTMLVLYHWPFGGWRVSARQARSAPEEAVDSEYRS